jgi:hypothetical protein
LLKNRTKAPVYAAVEGDSLLFSAIGVSSGELFCIPPGSNEAWWRRQKDRTLTLCDASSKAKWKHKRQVEPGDVIVIQSHEDIKQFNKDMRMFFFCFDCLLTTSI